MASTASDPSAAAPLSTSHDPAPEAPEAGIAPSASPSAEVPTSPSPEPDIDSSLDPSLDPSPPSPDFITTHVLDQVSGTPAGNINTTLTLISTKSRPSYTALTNPQTGRISNWTPTTEKTAPMEQVLPILMVIKSQSAPGWKSVWSLRFDTGEYWEGKAGAKGEGQEGGGRGRETFYPEVEIKFYVDPEDSRRHWHVPVLLGPHGYTTYRGS
ncbi:MAG: hypothetical protein MMC23_006839 [Stictis urceolatum]|nr:hypothetical protein [Stictis urceolata]